jgi:uncharacterized membrane protein YfcA
MMTPDLSVLIPFFLIVILGVYFQTVTGFGLAMVIIGLASGIGIASVADLASVVSILALVNGCIALRGLLRHIDWGITGTVTAAVIPASVLGVLLLDYLSSTASYWLQFTLGLIIGYAGLSFTLRQRTLPHVSGRTSFFAYGIFGGIIGGMFGIAGPPLVFQFYRQPMDLNRIRAHLILIFTLIAAARTAFVAGQGQLTFSILWISVACIPVVVLATWIARRRPPRLSESVSRRIAFLLLMVMGITLIIPMAQEVLTVLSSYL